MEEAPGPRMRAEVQKIRGDTRRSGGTREVKVLSGKRASSALRGLPAVNPEFSERSKFQKARPYTSVALTRSSSRILLARDNEFWDHRAAKSRGILSRPEEMEA